MKTILTFILALLFTFNISNTFSQTDIVFNDTDWESQQDTVIQDTILNFVVEAFFDIYDGYNHTITIEFNNSSNNMLFFTNGSNEQDTIIKNENLNTIKISKNLNNDFILQDVDGNSLIVNKQHYFNLKYHGDYNDTLTINYNFPGMSVNNENNKFDVILVDPATLSIEEFNQVKVTDVNIYPNPTVNSVTIDFETDLQDIPVELYSMNGQLLKVNNDNRYFGRNSVQMEMYDYPKGIYLIKVGEAVRKVVK